MSQTAVVGWLGWVPAHAREGLTDEIEALAPGVDMLVVRRSYRIHETGNTSMAETKMA